MYVTFLENDEPKLITQIRGIVAKDCEDSAVAAANNQQLQPHDVHIYYVDLGDGNVMYYLNDEASKILARSGTSIASAQESIDLPEDASNLLSSRHFRFG